MDRRISKYWLFRKATYLEKLLKKTIKTYKLDQIDIHKIN